MNTEKITNHCPKCQAPLPANAPQGLCPKCLMSAAATPTEAGQPTQSTPAPPLAAVAAAFPQLEIIELIGQGGMGVVYKARQRRLERFVALKLLPQSLAADATFAERFNREARVLARLNHPNIVTVHDFGQANGFFYLLMEYVDGVNLRQAMEAGRFTPQQAMLLVPKICEALQFAHDEGILHRDIKPENILLDTKGRVKIADFGIAKLVGEAKEKITLTACGMAVGTPHYMAPEQLEHPQDVDQRADIYSLGVVFYEMLTGELPIGRFAPPSHKSKVDVRVDEVVFHALEREREKRFRSASEVKTSVEAITGQMPAGAGPSGAAASPAQPAPAAAVPPVRVACYFNTPSHMRDCFPSAAARIFACKGELELGTENLTFTGSFRTTVTIPLKAIEDLSIGQFQMWTTPWVRKYARINFLAVTFREQGQSKTVLLTPVEPGASSASRINDYVGHWFDRLQRAASQCAGRTPPSSDTASVSISAESPFNRKTLGLLWALLIIIPLPYLIKGAALSSPGLMAFTVADLALCIFLLWYAVGFLRADRALTRGNLDAVTSDEPLSAEPVREGGGRVHSGRAGVRPFCASTVILMIAVCVAVFEAGWLVALGRSNAHRVLTPPAAAPASGPGSEFVLYTIPTLAAGGNSATTNAMVWRFKCLVPAEHMARILFVRWSNNVPLVENAGSAFYEVGNASMDQDLFVSCSPPVAGRPNQPTVDWAVSLFGKRTALVTVPEEARYRRLETPAHLTLRSGHQAIIRLVDYVTPAGQPVGGNSGIELRIFLEPLKFAPVRTDPFQVQEQNYVAGTGPGWTTEQALEAIKQWPVEK
jgi:tRNA A-37 threonylcarbamoyl transferase component Bud32